MAVVAAGNSHTDGLADVSLVTVSSLATMLPPDDPGPGCSFANDLMTAGESVAVAFSKTSADLIVQSRQPAMLQIHSSTLGYDLSATISLSDVTREDTGHAIFHSNAGGFIACASCHGEGGDDGRVWTFDGEGQRRTQSLRGGISGTEPFHWSGEMRDLPTLAEAVFHGRMVGPALNSDQVSALGHFLDAIPVVPPSSPADSTAVTRGQALFQGDAGCSGCHSGAHYTNNTTVDVGTGDKFQVPRLTNLWTHAPYLHDGRASNILDRFTNGGAAHGNTASLTPSQISDLVAYLSTL
jgi:mono/diheme cytochrome c family protein